MSDWTYNAEAEAIERAAEREIAAIEREHEQRTERFTAERNRARDLAAALEAQLAEATTLLRETRDELDALGLDRGRVVEAVAKVDEFLGRIGEGT